MSDLSIVISEDLKQIQALQETLEGSLTCIAQFQDDIASNHTEMTDMEALEAVLCVEVGHSFFPQDGVYEQMVATGALELIEDNEIIRFLEIGIPVYCTELIGDSWAIDTPEDVEIVNKLMEERSGKG